MIKILGQNESINYGEWYVDTIKVNIPPKPVAYFSVEDSVICQYNPIKIFNRSKSMVSKSNSFEWTLSDGQNSKDSMPQFRMDSIGTFDLKLVYRNGYCDSVFIKKSYIKVIKAPKPGLNVSQSSGCAPLKISISDTFTFRSISKKRYWFSDKDSVFEIDIQLNQYNKTFSKPGVYYFKQILHGLTGCINESDSFKVNVSYGITKSDTVHIINSSVEENGVSVIWENYHPNLTYGIFKNGVFQTKTNDTQYFDPINYVMETEYSIKAYDSCGSESSSGRIGKPILLKVNMIGYNEAALINFSNYKDWLDTKLNYCIQKRINNQWVNINCMNSNGQFIDDDFLKEGEIEVFYRIMAHSYSNPTIVTYSNVVCLQYTPTLFIPNAFTPNKDQRNDSFEPVTYGIVDYQITVINRWGEIIFKGDKNNKWSPTDLPDGVYTVLIEYSTKAYQNLTRRVNVTLLR